MKDVYYRPITHQNYPNKNFRENYPKSFHGVQKEIVGKDFWRVSQKKMDNDTSVFYYADDEFLCQHPYSRGVPLVLGGFSLVIVIGMLCIDDEWTIIPIIVFSIFCTLLILSIVYYFTMPKNESILNRRDGTITFDNFLWNKDVTMPFENVIFSFSTGGNDAIGAYILQIVRPKNHTFTDFVFGNDCYESISGITWYMDRNRPLPPGTAFDPFRQKDFERRKAEGFPPPLYPSQVPTPEATEAQQKEREKYWED